MQQLARQSSRVEFNPLDPFPLLAPDSCELGQSQRHAEQVDAWLGLRVAETEAQLGQTGGRFPDVQTWRGLPAQSMLTPYLEIRSLLHLLELKPGQTLVDLGAGYGRMAFVLARHGPGVKFVGYELVSARVAEARRCLGSVPGIELVTADLARSDFHPTIADAYFLYDYGTRAAIEKTLQDLRGIATSRAVTVIGRGRASRDAIERDHPWLSQIVPPRHFRNYSIYRSAEETL